MESYRSLVEIEQILRNEGTKRAYEEINTLLKFQPNNAEAWYMLGGILRREEQWGEAINAYNRAKFLNPEGPAAYAVDAIYDIIHFVNKELMNP